MVHGDGSGTRFRRCPGSLVEVLVASPSVVDLSISGGVLVVKAASSVLVGPASVSKSGRSRSRQQVLASMRPTTKAREPAAGGCRGGDHVAVTVARSASQGDDEGLGHEGSNIEGGRGRWWRSSRQRSLARPGCLLVVGSYGRDEPQVAALGAPVLEARISKRHRRKGRPEETLGGRRGREIERDNTLTVSWRREGVRGEATGTSGEG